MQSTGFRLVSIGVALLLLLALMFVIMLVAQNHPISVAPQARPSATVLSTSVGNAVGGVLTPLSPEAVSTRDPATIVASRVSPTTPVASQREALTPNLISSTLPIDVVPAVSPTRMNASRTPVAPAPGVVEASSAHSAWEMLTNGNFINDLVVVDGTIWAATAGGILAWQEPGATPRHYTTVDGLLENSANAVVDCPLPNLGVVFGAKQGLQIFDREQEIWNTLTRANSPMSFDDVVALACDQVNQRLILGYARQGIDIYDARTNQWTYIDQASGLVSNLVKATVVNEAQDAVWVATNFAISVLVDGEIVSLNSGNSPLETNQVAALESSAAGTVWIAGQDALYRVEKPLTGQGIANGVWGVFPMEEGGEALFLRDLAGLAAVDDGTVWLGTHDAQLCHFDPSSASCVETFHRQDGMVDGPLTTLFWSADGQLLYGTDGNGFSRYDGTEWQPFVAQDIVLASNQIRDVVQDADGAIWVATDRGIQNLGPAAGIGPRQGVIFNRIRGELPVTSVQDLHPDPARGIWFGGAAAGYYDGRRWTNYTVLNGLVGSPVQAITVDGDERVWLGTDDGLSILNQGSFFNLTRAEGLPNTTILALLADAGQKDGEVWIGTNGGGLLRFQKNQLQVFNRDTAGLPSNSITALARDADGSLLVGTSLGLARLTSDQATQIRILGANPVTALASDESGHVWVGTDGAGVYHFNGTTWQQLSTRDGLPSHHIATILRDQAGDVWIGGITGGLVRYTPEN